MAIHHTFNKAFIEGFPMASSQHPPCGAEPRDACYTMVRILPACCHSRSLRQKPKKCVGNVACCWFGNSALFWKSMLLFLLGGAFPVVDMSWVWSKQNSWQNSDRPCSRCRVSERLVTVCRLEVFCYVAVRWGGMITFFALVYAWSMLSNCDVGTHGRCYAMVGVGWGGVSTLFACPHMVDATQLWCWCRVHTWPMLHHAWGGVGSGRTDIDEMLDSWIPCSVNTE